MIHLIQSKDYKYILICMFQILFGHESLPLSDKDPQTTGHRLGDPLTSGWDNTANCPVGPFLALQ